MALVDLTAYSDFAFLLLRISLGAVFIYQGQAKLFKDRESFAKGMNWPVWQGASLGLVEFVSGISVLLGIYPQLGALGIIVAMLGSLYYNIFVWKKAFTEHGVTGWEYNLVLLAGALVLLTTEWGFKIIG